MKRIEPPSPTKYDLIPRLKNDPQVKKWTQRIMANPEAKTTDLTEDQLAFVMSQVMAQRGEGFEPTPYKQAMIDTRPVLCAPDWTDEVEDLGHIFEQPELRQFWENWNGERNSSGPTPNDAGTKASMVIFAMTGSNKHFDKFLRSLGRDPQMLAIFDEPEGAPVTLPPYSTLMRQIKDIAPTCAIAAMEANIECVKALRALYPNKRIGKRLLIDGSDVPAWCRQEGARDDEADKKLRAHTPDAGFRRYTYGPNGKEIIQDGETVRFGPNKEVKAWRGYYLAVIADQATGLPLVWTLFDAAKDEAPSIVPLLSLLHKLWPDIDAECIAGDSAWDEHEWNRLCEVDYGIAPIFRLHPSYEKEPHMVLKSKDSRDGSIRAITGTGQLICAEHMKPLPYNTFDRPNRAGLRPGQSTDDRAFRLRALCTHSTKDSPHPCGKIGLKAMTSWLRLTRYPHHMQGDPQRHAWRVAMLARLNGIESIFNRLKCGKLLGAKGADRTRLRRRESVEALLSLACLSMSALMLACERDHLGIVIPTAGNSGGGNSVGTPSSTATTKRNAHQKRPSGAHHIRQRMTPAKPKRNANATQPTPFDLDDVVRMGFM